MTRESEDAKARTERLSDMCLGLLEEKMTQLTDDPEQLAKTKLSELLSANQYLQQGREEEDKDININIKVI